MRKTSLIRQGQRPANHRVCRRTPTPIVVEQVDAVCQVDRTGRLYACKVASSPPPSRWQRFVRAADAAAPTAAKYADIVVMAVRGVRKP